jgi:hypothetical protein
MKRLFLTVFTILMLCASAFAIWDINYENVTNDMHLETLLKDIHGDRRGIYTYANGLTVDNINNNIYEWNENSEDLLWTVSSDWWTLSSTTSASVSFGTLVPNVDSIDVDSDIYFNPRATEPADTTGRVYYDDTNGVLAYYGASSWVALSSGTGDNTLDNAYDQGGSGSGRTITASDGAVTITSTDADTAYLLSVTPTPSSSAATGGVQITSGANATQDALNIVNSGSGDDIQAGAGAFTVSAAGAVASGNLAVTGTASVSSTFTASAGVTLDSGGTVTNATDTEIQFAEDTEDFSIDFVTDEIDFKSGTGVVTVGWGDLDAHTGLNTLAFDAAASSITLAADGAGDDFTVGVTGAQNSSLIISSAGTAADALQVTASAGGIDIASSGGAGEDIDVSTSGSSINLTSAEADGAAIVLNASDSAGGIDIDCGTGTFDLLVTGGAMSIDAQNAASNVSLVSNGAGDDFTVSLTGATDSSLILSSTGTEADALQITASAGGIDIAATGAAGQDVDISNTGGSVNISADEDIATGIVINSSTGGIDITADGAAAKDLDLTCTNGSINLVSGEAVVASTFINSSGGVDVDAVDDIALTITSGTGGEDILLTQTGGNDSGIIITTAGTGSDAISLQMDGTGGGLDVDTDDGAISIVADGAANGDITVDSEDDMALTAAGDLTVTVTGTTTLPTSILRTTSVELTNSDIKNLRGTPKELVAAPGAGALIEFISAILILDYGSDVLTESADNMAMEYDGGSAATASEAIEATNFIDQGADTITTAVPVKDVIDAASDIVNKNLCLAQTGDGEYGGNGSNDSTMTVIITYRVHSTLGL